MQHQIKHLAIVATLISCTIFARAQSGDTGIVFFNGTFAEAVKKANEAKKYLFLDAYASWCGPCKTMEIEIFKNPSVAHYFNSKFISIRVDMEKGEGPELAKNLTSIDGYPSLLFFTPDGHLSKTILGSRTAKIFLREAKLVAR